MRDDRNETFNTLFGTNHRFYGYADLFLRRRGTEVRIYGLDGFPRKGFPAGATAAAGIAAAANVGLFDMTINAVLNTAVIISMALTPLAPIVTPLVVWWISQPLARVRSSGDMPAGMLFMPIHWSGQFAHLQEYRRRYPDSWPFAREEFPKGNRLGLWVWRQRQNITPPSTIGIQSSATAMVCRSSISSVSISTPGERRPSGQSRAFENSLPP